MFGETLWGAVVFVILGGAAVLHWLAVKDPPKGETRGLNAVLALAFTGLAVLALITVIGVITDA